eukprot:856544-Pyramimonas_sp.AAC.1
MKEAPWGSVGDPLRGPCGAMERQACEAHAELRRRRGFLRGPVELGNAYLQAYAFHWCFRVRVQSPPEAPRGFVRG